MFYFLLDLLFPRHCLACGDSGAYFCLHCRDCLLLANYAETDYCSAIFNYDDPAVKKAVWKLKYFGITSLAGEMAALMCEHLSEDLAELSAFSGRQKILVIPVPLSRDRQRRRGYNQAALLARGLAKQESSFLEYRADLLVKIKETPAQVSLHQRAARLAQFCGAFPVI